MERIKKLWNYWWVAILFIIAPYLIMAKIPDTDTFFLLKTGQYIIENSIVPTLNPFVIHEGFQVIIQQWLFDISIYGAYSALGNIGIFLFVASAYAISIALLYKYFGLFTTNQKARGIITLLSALIYISYGVARPTCISFIVMVSLLYSIEKYKRTNKKSWLAVLPFLSLLEVNVHSAMWPMMFVLILPYIFPFELLRKGNLKEKTKEWLHQNKYILLTIFIMLVIGFINPNGIDGMTYVLYSYGSVTGGIPISELLPPNTDSRQGLTIMAVIAFLAIYVYKNKSKFKNQKSTMQKEFTRIAMACGVLILACMHYRNMWYLLLGATPVVLELLNNSKIKIKKPKWLNSFRKGLLTIIAVFLVVFLSGFMLSISNFSTTTTKDSQYTPIKAAQYLDKHQKNEIVLFTEFNNGAFMEWSGYKVYMDARPELFQKKINGKEDIFTEYSNLATGKIEYEEFLRKYQFTHLVVAKKTLFEMYLSANADYTAVVDGTGYKLYEHTGK